jgi:hypothetical protein
MSIKSTEAKIEKHITFYSRLEPLIEINAAASLASLILIEEGHHPPNAYGMFDGGPVRQAGVHSTAAIASLGG